jgi:chitinase
MMTLCTTGTIRISANVPTATFTKNKGTSVFFTVLDQGFRVLSNDPIFSAPYNYPQRDYKDEVYEAYAHVASGPWRKRDLLEDIMDGNLTELQGAERVRDKVVEDEEVQSKDVEDEDNGEDTSYVQGMDCNECDIVLDDRIAATYVNPEYAHASGMAQWSETASTTAPTASLIDRKSSPTPPSPAKVQKESQGPMRTSTSQDIVK